MNNKGLFIVLAAVLSSPACCAITYFVDTAVSRNNLAKVILLILFGGGFLLYVRWFGVTLWSKFNSPKAAMQLAEEMGLVALNQKDDPKFAFYGGSFQGVPFGITPSSYTSRYNLNGESRIRFESFLRTAIPIKSEVLSGIAVRRTPNDKGKPDQFESAFPMKENVGLLSDGTKQAMLNFIQKGYRTRNRYSSLFGADVRNLGLLDRYYIGEGRIDKEVFAETAVFLIQDHPNPLSITPDHLETILREMIEVTNVAEKEG